MKVRGKKDRVMFMLSWLAIAFGASLEDEANTFRGANVKGDKAPAPVQSLSSSSVRLDETGVYDLWDVADAVLANTRFSDSLQEFVDSPFAKYSRFLNGDAMFAPRLGGDTERESDAYLRKVVLWQQSRAKTKKNSDESVEDVAGSALLEDEKSVKKQYDTGKEEPSDIVSSAYSRQSSDAKGAGLETGSPTSFAQSDDSAIMGLDADLVLINAESSAVDLQDLAARLRMMDGNRTRALDLSEVESSLLQSSGTRSLGSKIEGREARRGSSSSVWPEADCNLVAGAQSLSAESVVPELLLHRHNTVCPVPHRVSMLELLQLKGKSFYESRLELLRDHVEATRRTRSMSGEGQEDVAERRRFSSSGELLGSATEPEDEEAERNALPDASLLQVRGQEGGVDASDIEDREKLASRRHKLSGSFSATVEGEFLRQLEVRKTGNGGSATRSQPMNYGRGSDPDSSLGGEETQIATDDLPASSLLQRPIYKPASVNYFSFCSGARGNYEATGGGSKAVSAAEQLYLETIKFLYKKGHDLDLLQVASPVSADSWLRHRYEHSIQNGRAVGAAESKILSEAVMHNGWQMPKDLEELSGEYCHKVAKCAPPDVEDCERRIYPEVVDAFVGAVFVQPTSDANVRGGKHRIVCNDLSEGEVLEKLMEEASKVKQASSLSDSNSNVCDRVCGVGSKKHERKTREKIRRSFMQTTTGGDITTREAGDIAIRVADPLQSEETSFLQRGQDANRIGDASRTAEKTDTREDSLASTLTPDHEVKLASVLQLDASSSKAATEQRQRSRSAVVSFSKTHNAETRMPLVPAHNDFVDDFSYAQDNFEEFVPEGVAINGDVDACRRIAAHLDIELGLTNSVDGRNDAGEFDFFLDADARVRDAQRSVQAEFPAGWEQKQDVGNGLDVFDVYTAVEESFYQRFRLYNHWQLLGECEKANALSPSFLPPLDLTQVDRLVRPELPVVKNGVVDWRELARAQREGLDFDGFWGEHRRTLPTECTAWNFYARVATVREMKTQFLDLVNVYGADRVQAILKRSMEGLGLNSIGANDVHNNYLLPPGLQAAAKRTANNVEPFKERLLHFAKRGDRDRLFFYYLEHPQELWSGGVWSHFTPTNAQIEKNTMLVTQNLCNRFFLPHAEYCVDFYNLPENICEPVTCNRRYLLVVAAAAAAYESVYERTFYQGSYGEQALKDANQPISTNLISRMFGLPSNRFTHRSGGAAFRIAYDRDGASGIVTGGISGSAAMALSRRQASATAGRDCMLLGLRHHHISEEAEGIGELLQELYCTASKKIEARLQMFDAQYQDAADSCEEREKQEALRYNDAFALAVETRVADILERAAPAKLVKYLTAKEDAFASLRNDLEQKSKLLAEQKGQLAEVEAAMAKAEREGKTQDLRNFSIRSQKRQLIEQLTHTVEGQAKEMELRKQEISELKQESARVSSTLGEQFKNLKDSNRQQHEKLERIDVVANAVMCAGLQRPQWRGEPQAYDYGQNRAHAGANPLPPPGSEAPPSSQSSPPVVATRVPPGYSAVSVLRPGLRVWYDPQLDDRASNALRAEQMRLATTDKTLTQRARLQGYAEKLVETNMWSNSANAGHQAQLMWKIRLKNEDYQNAHTVPEVSLSRIFTEGSIAQLSQHPKCAGQLVKLIRESIRDRTTWDVMALDSSDDLVSVDRPSEKPVQNKLDGSASPPSTASTDEGGGGRTEGSAAYEHSEAASTPDTGSGEEPADVDSFLQLASVPTNKKGVRSGTTRSHHAQDEDESDEDQIDGAALLKSKGRLLRRQDHRVVHMVRNSQADRFFQRFARSAQRHIPESLLQVGRNLRDFTSRFIRLFHFENGESTRDRDSLQETDNVPRRKDHTKIGKHGLQSLNKQDDQHRDEIARERQRLKALADSLLQLHRADPALSQPGECKTLTGIQENQLEYVSSSLMVGGRTSMPNVVPEEVDSPGWEGHAVPEAAASDDVSEALDNAAAQAADGEAPGSSEPAAAAEDPAKQGQESDAAEKEEESNMLFIVGIVLLVLAVLLGIYCALWYFGYVDLEALGPQTSNEDGRQNSSNRSSDAADADKAEASSEDRSSQQKYPWSQKIADAEPADVEAILGELDQDLALKVDEGQSAETLISERIRLEELASQIAAMLQEVPEENESAKDTLTDYTSKVHSLLATVREWLLAHDETGDVASGGGPGGSSV
ncbi:unnamed protein product [Amoebophrya sp. A25]|nr:unnamed protein product [Amoebophrya sp. A25]|eukprot:GSA25T00017622001.1